MENKKSKKIAIFIDSPKSSGGIFQELSSFLKKFYELSKNFNTEFEVVTNVKKLDFHADLKNIKINYFNLNLFQRTIHHLFNFNIFFKKIKNLFRIKSKFEIFLEKNNFDFIIFTSTSQYSLYLQKTNYCLWVQDVDHREYLEFPEVGEIDLFLWKEKIYENSIKRASIIITGCEIIKNRICDYYKVSKKRIVVINQEPSLSIQKFKKIFSENSSLNIEFKKKYEINNDYIFYPAMYFPHKNHKLILDSLKIINSKDLNLSAVFCGHDKGYLQNLIDYSKKISINDKVKFLKFIPDEEIPYFYVNSIALVMPTLMGPNNIPPWEAFSLKVPVFYSKLDDISLVLKDAAYYFDPLDPKSLSTGIIRFYKDKDFFDNLKENGTQLIRSINIEDDYKKLFHLIIRNRIIRERWEFNL